MKNASHIALKNISKRFDETTALHPTDMLIEAGKITVLIGPSGCGKSTLLRLITGLLFPTTGSIMIGNTPLNSDTLAENRRRIGYVIQDGGLFPHLTAGQNITLMAGFLKWPARQIQERLEALCPITHFNMDLLPRYPVELSGGQRQRVSLMRALMLDPSILLLDEPLGALDPMVRAAMQQELKSIFRQLGKTVIMVTHDMAEAGYFGDRIALMKAGKIVQSGTLADLKDNPADPFVREFMNAQQRTIMNNE